MMRANSRTSQLAFLRPVFTFTALIIFACSCTLRSYFSDDSVCTMLRTSTITKSVSMRTHLKSIQRQADFDNEVFLLTLDTGMRAVFKPCSDQDDLTDAYAEIAAYHASQFLQCRLVPPTVLRTVNGLTGSLQLYIDTEIDALKPSAFEELLATANPDDVANLKIFYFVFGQWDSGPHNLLFYLEGDRPTLAAIDNSGIGNRQYVQYGQLPFVRIWYNEQFETNDYDSPFPFGEAHTYTNPTLKDLLCAFNNLVPSELCQRLARKKILRLVIYHNALWVQFHAGDQNFKKSYTS